MSQDNLIKMECTECGQRRYDFKSKKIKERLELRRQCSKCGTHVTHKEAK